jgi:dTMP kinase
MLIAFEGIDGSGKTSITRYLKKELQKMGYDVVLFKEPTNSEWGIRLKKSAHLEPEEELELFIRDRIYDVERNIIPALKQGKIVLMDRYYYSTIAYQGALGLDINEIKQKNEEIAPKPDLIIYMDIAPEKAIKRVTRRGKPDRFEDIGYLRRVREIFLSLNDDMEIINSDEHPEIVRKKIIKLILDRIT